MQKEAGRDKCGTPPSGAAAPARWERKAPKTIDLHVRPGPALPREQLLSMHPPHSIALDGYVFGEPFFEGTTAGPHRSVNHHEAVDRTSTMAARPRWS